MLAPLETVASSDADPLDFSHEEPQAAAVDKRPSITAYDPRPQEDQARRHIAYALIALMWVLVGGVLIQVSFGSIPVGDIKEYAVLIGPVVALVSAATGFYYGTKTQTTG